MTNHVKQYFKHVIIIIGEVITNPLDKQSHRTWIQRYEIGYPIRHYSYIGFNQAIAFTYSLISRVTNQTWPKTGVNDDYHHHELVGYKCECESHLQVWLEKRYVGSRHTSEWFNTAGRNVKTGLIASVIVSQVMCSGRRPSLLKI